MSETTSPTPARRSLLSRLGFIKPFVSLISLGVLVATLFTALTPVGLVANSLAGMVGEPRVFEFAPTPGGVIPTATPRPRPRIGIVAGHWGNDPGAVCPDELTEAQVNLTVATLVQKRLNAAGFDVDLLKEFDSQLTGYRALTLVSIHADSCEYINDQATGFKVAAALSTSNSDQASRLTACLRNRYTLATGLPYHAGSITSDMTSYHAFEEIHPDTIAVIIEIGFLNLDRQLLTQNPEAISKGITDGVLCYLYNEDISQSGATP